MPKIPSRFAKIPILQSQSAVTNTSTRLDLCGWSCVAPPALTAMPGDPGDTPQPGKVTARGWGHDHPQTDTGTPEAVLMKLLRWHRNLQLCSDAKWPHWYRTFTQKVSSFLSSWSLM